MINEDIIFIKPKRFEDSIEYIGYIKANKIIHINLAELDSEKSQRILDFISGAVHIQDGVVINPADKIYCVIPKNIEYKLEYREVSKNITNPSFDEVEEIIPRYKR